MESFRRACAFSLACAQRPAAKAFPPGERQVITPTPIGDRFERFPMGEVLTDTDPSGNQLSVESHWSELGCLVTVAKPVDEKKTPFVTSRFIRDGELIQETTHDGLSFRRVFQRKEMRL